MNNFFTLNVRKDKAAHTTIKIIYLLAGWLVGK